MKTVFLAMLSCLTLCASPISALTTQEREWAIEARGYFQKAKEQALEQQKVIEDQNKENGVLDQLAKGQQKQIVTLSGQVDKSYENEKELARYNAYAKPIIDQVNSMWGIGGIIYGFKVLSKHLFILLAVLAGLALAIFVLSFFFPFIGAFIRMAGSWLATIFRRLTKKRNN